MDIKEIVKIFEENPETFKPKVIEMLIWVAKNDKKADVIIGRAQADIKEKKAIMRELFDNDLGEAAVLAVYALAKAKEEMPH